MHESPPSLFPPIMPTRHGMLEVDELHTIYWEEVGNPDGVPVLFLHGGPGAGLSPQHRRFFDPAALPRDPVRPARRRQVDPAGRVAQQHHPAADRGHRNAARQVRHRAMAGVRRLVGLDPGAGLRPGPSRALPGLRAARDLPVHRRRNRLVPARRAVVLSRAVRRIHRAHSRRTSAATCSRPTPRACCATTRPSTGRRRAPGAASKDAACSCCRSRRSRCPTRSTWASAGSNRTTWPTSASSRTTS